MNSRNMELSTAELDDSDFAVHGEGHADSEARASAGTRCASDRIHQWRGCDCRFVHARVAREHADTETQSEGLCEMLDSIVVALSSRMFQFFMKP